MSYIDWISVGTELPKIGEKVLIYYHLPGIGKNLGQGYLKLDGWYIHLPYDSCRLTKHCQPTYWAEIPNFPESVEPEPEPDPEPQESAEDFDKRVMAIIERLLVEKADLLASLAKR